MIRNLAVTATVSILMGLFAVAYTSIRPPADRPLMAGGLASRGSQSAAGTTAGMATADRGLMLLAFRGQTRFSVFLPWVPRSRVRPGFRFSPLCKANRLVGY